MVKVKRVKKKIRKEEKIQSVIFYKNFKCKYDVRCYCRENGIKGEILKNDKDYMIVMRPKYKFRKLRTCYNSKKGVKIIKGVLK